MNNATGYSTPPSRTSGDGVEYPVAQRRAAGGVGGSPPMRARQRTRTGSRAAGPGVAQRRCLGAVGGCASLHRDVLGGTPQGGGHGCAGIQVLGGQRALVRRQGGVLAQEATGPVREHLDGCRRRACFPQVTDGLGDAEEPQANRAGIGQIGNGPAVWIGRGYESLSRGHELHRPEAGRMRHRVTGSSFRIGTPPAWRACRPGRRSRRLWRRMGPPTPHAVGGRPEPSHAGPVTLPRRAS